MLTITIAIISILTIIMEQIKVGAEMEMDKRPILNKS